MNLDEPPKESLLDHIDRNKYTILPNGNRQVKDG